MARQQVLSVVEDPGVHIPGESVEPSPEGGRPDRGGEVPLPFIRGEEVVHIPDPSGLGEFLDPDHIHGQHVERRSLPFQVHRVKLVLLIR